MLRLPRPPHPRWARAAAGQRAGGARQHVGPSTKKPFILSHLAHEHRTLLGINYRGLLSTFQKCGPGGTREASVPRPLTSPSLTGGPAREEEEGRWLRAGQRQPCLHRARLLPLRALLAPRIAQGSTPCQVAPEARLPPVSWGTSSRGVRAGLACSAVCVWERVGLRPPPQGSRPSQLRRWLSLSPPST